MRRFIYLDTDTLNSYIAQIYDGLLQTQETETQSSQATDKQSEQTSKLEESISFYSTLQGKNNDEYCQNLYGKTFDEFVKASAGQQLVYQAIAEKEGLNITEYEYKDDLEQFAKDSGYSQVSTFTDKFLIH